MSGALVQRVRRRIRRLFKRAPASLRFARSRRCPAQKWNVRRRVMVCTAAAAGAFTVAAYAWRAIEAGDRATSKAAIDALEQRLSESRGKLARLPELREAGRAQPAQERSATRAAGGSWHGVADLASRAGVTLRALTPASSPAALAKHAGTGDMAGRALQMEGRADFSGLSAFLNGLSTLPVLVVPEAIDIKKDNGSLSFGATLGVFDMPPPRADSPIHSRSVPTVMHSEAGRAIADPFGDVDAGDLTHTPVGRLVGIVHDGRRGLALFEAASGPLAVTAVPGQTVGQDRLVSIDATGVTLASRAGTRRVSLSEDER